MKVVIAGSRDIMSLGAVNQAIKKSGFKITEVVSGCASGVDTVGELWAEIKGLPVKEFPSEWSKHGRSAGPIRNGEMAKYADCLIAIWDGKSSGTKNMIEQMKKLNKPHFIYLYPPLD